jgi:hypothetical protein
VIDISNPQTPKVVGLYKGASVSRVAVSNNTAYLVADTIHVVDVSDPTAPTQVSTYRGQGNLVDLQAARHQLYITWRGYNTAGTDIIDVSEPISPKLLGVVNENFFPGDSAGANSYGYTVGYDELQIVDISNPQHPLNVGFYNVAGSKVIVANNHIFVSSYQSGFFIFKQLPIRLPRPAVTVDQVGHFGGAANTVSIRDHYAYMGSGPEVSILDISDPTRPRRIGQFVLPGERTVTVQDITIEGSLAYVVANTALWVLDV